MKRLALLLFAVCLPLSACKSIPSGRGSFAYLKVYDFENNGAMGVRAAVDGKPVGETDIHGRLVIPLGFFQGDGAKKGVLSLEKEGFERVVSEEAFAPGALLYFRIGTADDYMEAAESDLDEGRLARAERNVGKAIEIERRKDALLLKAVILARGGRKAEAEALLSEIGESKEGDEERR